MGTYENARLKTKQKIIKAFWNLYREKSIDKITVKDITDACKIHRATFYLHFSDVYAVLEEMEEELLSELRDICQCDAVDLESRYGVAHKIYFHYLRRWEFLHYMLKDPAATGFSAAYKQILIDYVCRLNGIRLSDMKTKERTVVQVVLNGMADMFIICADEDRLTFDDMMNIIKGYSCNGITNVLRDKYHISLHFDLDPKNCTDE
ncbi:MAG: TetR/AcrR family transcriptional regulator [Brotaphodocola sp.]